VRTPRRAVELELEGFYIEEAGWTEGPYLGRFELRWPRPGIERVRTLIPLPDRIGEEVDWSGVSLSRKWLFKEDMEGRMVLRAAVTPLREPGGADTAGEAVDLIGRALARESSLTWRTLGDLLDLGGAAARYLLTGPRKTIAEGDVVIREQTGGVRRVDLHAPNPLYRREAGAAHRPEKRGDHRGGGGRAHREIGGGRQRIPRREDVGVGDVRDRFPAVRRVRDGTR